MAGLLPLNHQEIRAWSVLTGHRPTPLDVDALFTIDAVMAHPEKFKTKAEPVERPQPKWPERKNG